MQRLDPQKTSMRLAARSKLGSYEVLTPLGAGGMGEVYRARDTRLARDVIRRTVDWFTRYLLRGEK